MLKNVVTSFKISAMALAVGQAFAPAAYAQQPEVDVVVVTGIRASARSSLAIKRDAMEVVDSITAEDIGKLPDPNVAETLTRIPGVQGYRYGGEGASPVGVGSGITIRGLSGQTASQVNGRAYFTAGSREFNIEGAIPGMVAGVDVFKNPSAEHIEGGIGGLVNVRTRDAADFKSLTVSGSVNGRYNDLSKKYDPELFGLVANRWDLGGGSRLGLMGAAVYQKSTGRSDNNPANGNPNFKRAVRADSAEYRALATANTANAPGQPLSSLVGRSDIHYMAGVPSLATSSSVGPNIPNLAGLNADQVSNVMTAPGLTSNVFQETIMRERQGFNGAADYRVTNTLRFFAEVNYIKYTYHQNYRGLNSNDGANVQNLQTTPFAYDEGLANRNLNGGNNDSLLSKRLLGGTFLNSTVSTTGGDELTPYVTWIGAAGMDWKPTPELSLKADFSYVDATKRIDNRSVNMESAPGRLWSTTRVADGAPHQLSFAGPNLADPANYVYNKYNNGNNQKFDDDGFALALSGAYTLGDGMFQRLKFGTRFTDKDSTFRSYSFNDRPLTTNGLPLAADRSNAINAGSGGLLEASPDNFMNGEAGYAGGFVVYKPSGLSGNQVRTLFPNAGILEEANYVESVVSRRVLNEKTQAVYLSSDFALFEERLKGNLGVRVVRTESSAIAQTADLTVASSPITEVRNSTSYVNVLPSLNMTYDLTPNTIARFGYGRGMTRPSTDFLNPSVTVNLVNGTASLGNPELDPQVADSLDLSLEHYFSKTNYLAGAVFNKQIDGFFNGIASCQTVPTAPAYTGSVDNSCTGGQYQVTKQVASEKGWARGVELSGQYFFGADHGFLNNFGVAGSYTYVDTSNPVNFGTAAAPRIVDTPQPMQSKRNYTVSAMYENNKLSARLVYTWRSESILFNAPINPIEGRYIGAYGILDGSLNYEISDAATLSFNLSNILDKTLNRYIGEPGSYQTGLERQHYANGRTVSVGLRFKFGGK